MQPLHPVAEFEELFGRGGFGRRGGEFWSCRNKFFASTACRQGQQSQEKRYAKRFGSSFPEAGFDSMRMINQPLRIFRRIPLFDVVSLVISRKRSRDNQLNISGFVEYFTQESRKALKNAQLALP